MAPYEHNHRGVWAQTATIDWCESNYQLSQYVAEFWNTVSNLAFILPQMAQFISLSKHRSVEAAFKRAYLSLSLVGLGSLCFHMTLSKPMQMLDETSMILVSLHSFYLLYIIKHPQVSRQKLAALLVAYGLLFLCLYTFLVSWPIFHHTTFGLLVYASVAIGYQLKKAHGSYYKFWTVLILQHLAFVFWLIDKHYCEVLTQFREHHVPAVFRPLFQFHALWHLLMGLSSHIFICGVIRLRAWTKYREEFVIRYRWLGLWIALEKVSAEHSPLAFMDRRAKLASRRQKPDQLDRYAFLETNELRYRLKNMEPSDELDGSTDLNQNEVHNHHDLGRQVST